ncbi:hypothetical protein GQ457_06G035220 [Hibiscus cannabinus]
MRMHMVIGLRDPIWDMVAAGVLCLVRIHMVYMAVVRVWAMVEVLSAAVILEECTHPLVMVVITCIGDQMLLVALTHRCTLVVVWTVAGTWVVGVALVHTTDGIVKLNTEYGAFHVKQNVPVCVWVRFVQI